MLAGRVGPDENPVLPRRQSSKNFRLDRFRTRKTQASFHASKRVGRKASALLDGHANFVVPIQFVGCDSNQTLSKRRRRAKHFARKLFERRQLFFVSRETRLKPCSARDRRKHSKINSIKRNLRTVNIVNWQA